MTNKTKIVSELLRRGFNPERIAAAQRAAAECKMTDDVRAMLLLTAKRTKPSELLAQIERMRRAQQSADTSAKRDYIAQLVVVLESAIEV